MVCNEITVMRRITTIRSTTDRIYDDGPIILYYIIILTIVLPGPGVHPASYTMGT